MEWEIPVTAIHDAALLPNGNILLQQGWTLVQEVTPDRKVVWQYDAAKANPGKPVEVHIPFAAAVALPQRALQQIEGTWGVFVREGETAVFRPVRRGAELGGDVAVLGGVHPGESVVADGAYLLKALLLKRKGVGDDHDH